MVENKNMEKKTFTIADLLNGGLIGKTMKENLEFVEESKRLAATHDWLYHCTDADKLISILESKEMWMSNLKNVNDHEEAGRIDVPEYENKYFVACFTYDPNVPPEHWNEYGKNNGLIWAVQRTYFKKQIILLDKENKHLDDDQFRVFPDINKAFTHCIEMQRCNKLYLYPYYMFGFGFYQIVYDDELKKNIAGESQICMGKTNIRGRSLNPDIPGIIKATRGICQRDGEAPYVKDWTSEKEVRLKVSIHQVYEDKNGNEDHDRYINSMWFNRVAVPFTEEAFKTIRIKFSPYFVGKEDFIDRLHNLLPKANVEEL